MSAGDVGDLTATAPVARRGGQWPAILAVGVVSGLMIAAIILSLAALVFSGPLTAHLAQGSSLLLIGGAILNMAAIRWSSLRGSVILPQDATSAVAAVTLAALLPGVAATDRLSTALVYIAVASLVTGTVMVVLGGFRLGDIIRFVPYPVIGGFLAGTGWLLARGAVEVATGGFRWSTSTTIGVVVSVVFALALIGVLRFRPSVFVFPALLGAGVAVFYAVMAVLGLSVARARQLGLLPDVGSAAPGLNLDGLGGVDWSVLGAGAGGLLTMTLIAVLGLLLNVTALELISESDADLDRELRWVGSANILSSVTGSPPGYHALGATALGMRLGVRSPWVPAVVAVTCLGVAVGGTTVVGLLPVPIVAAILMMIGLSFMIDWLYDGFRKMTGPEYLLMVAIAVAVATLGFLAAVMLGMAAALILFAVTYSQIDPIRHITTGRERRSTIDRPPATDQILTERGGSIVIVELQGYLFFGTSRTLLRKIGAILGDTEVRRCLIVDLRRVPGVDSTVLAAFHRLGRQARDKGCAVVFSEAERSVASRLQDDDAAVTPDLEHALEVAEEMVLGEASGADGGLAEALGPGLWSKLAPNLRRLVVEPGVIVDVGDPSAGLFLVEAGRVVTEMPTEAGQWQRLRSSGPGAVLGEMSLYLGGGRTARLRATMPTTLYILDEETVAGIERTDPECAIALHRRIATVLAGRVVHGNDAIRSLLR